MNKKPDTCSSLYNLRHKNTLTRQTGENIYIYTIRLQMFPRYTRAISEYQSTSVSCPLFTLEAKYLYLYNNVSQISVPL